MRSLMILLVLLGTATADDRVDAETLFRIGAQAYKDGKYDAAAENFERAYQLYQAPEIAFSAAQAHRLHYQANPKDPGHVKRAIELFEIYIAATPEGGKRKDAVAHRDRLKDVLAKIEASGEKVVIAVKETPSIYVSVALETALITVDTKAVERYTSVDVQPGEHTVAVSADGYQPVERKVTVAKGQAIVPIELAPKPGAVTIKTAGDARLLIDGRPTALAAGPIEIPSGKRLIAVYARGKQPVTREIDLQPGQELTLDVPLHPTARRRAVKWVWIGGGVLLVSSMVTAGISIAADGNAADLRDSSDPLSTDAAARYDHLRDRRDTFRTASLVLGTATLATAATALWLYYFDRPSPDELSRPIEKPKAGGFAPLAFGDGLGLQYGGGF